MQRLKTVLSGCVTVTLCMVFAGAACGQAQPAQGEVIRIDAPGILDKPGATYLLTKDVTAEKTAFMIKGDGITLDLGGHTVTYGTAVGVDHCHGVFVRHTGGENDFPGVPAEGFGGGNDFTLKNGRIVQGEQPVAPPGTLTFGGLGRIVKEAPGHPKPGRYCFAVYVRACKGLDIEDITSEVNSRDSDSFHIRDCGDVNVHDNHFISTVREITDRHWPGTGVITILRTRGPVEIHHNVIDGGGQWGIRAAGDGHLVSVHHNVIRHRSYTTNGYAIGASAPNMRIYANVVKPVAGRGVHLTGDRVDFFNNIVDAKEKPNPEYPRTRTHGIKLEGCRYTTVHHNFSRVVAEEDFGDASPLDFSVNTLSFNRIFKNTIVAVRRTPKFEAYACNVYVARPRSFTQIHDNVFKTNHIHFRGDWGGVRDFDIYRNRFEVLPDAGKDYLFCVLGQSRAYESQGVVFRDNVLVPPADYRKLSSLYTRNYTRANIDFGVEWSVNVKTVDPAGNPVGGARVTAAKDGKELAWAVTDATGVATLRLLDFRIIGGAKGPFEEHGPYELVVTSGGREIKRQTLDPKETTNIDVTVVDPKRRVYVDAGANQRLTTGDVAKLSGRVVVVGEGGGQPQMAWKVLREVGDPRILTPNSATSDLVFANPRESWFQRAQLELEARLGDEVATDRVEVRADANITPDAVIRAPGTAKVNTIVQLDGSRSREPRGFEKSALRYRWKQVGGPETPLSSEEWPDPIFYPTEPGTYAFELTFSSPIATSGPARSTVVVTK